MGTPLSPRQIRIRNKIKQVKPYQFLRCNRPDIKVVCILDTFSFECFKYECYLEKLDVINWRIQLDRLKPDFLFAEFLGSFSRVIRDVILYCRQKGIPTVFWNKEDPVYYHSYIATARLFNFVFTTDANMVDKYKKDLGHHRVYPLPFAAQPVLHNPVELCSVDKENAAFAGTWYSDFPERQKDMRILLDPAKKYGLDIFDRMYNKSLPQFRFPMKYRQHIIGSLNYQEMVKAYKIYKVFMNVNTVKNSPTMFSRRVFELLGSGTIVLSTYAKGIEELFNGIVPLTFSQKETANHLTRILMDSEYREKLSLLGIREVYNKHLYKYRFGRILEVVKGRKELEDLEGVSIITITDKPEFIDRILENYQRQVWGNKELLIIFIGENPDSHEWLGKIAQMPEVSVFFKPGHDSWQDCLQFACNKTIHPFISFFSVEDYYAPHFITDLMHAFQYTNADIVGKQSYFSYIETKNTLGLHAGHQNQFVDSVPYSAMIMKRKVWEEMGIEILRSIFIESFFRKCMKKGYKIYSANRFNYVRILRDDLHSFTEQQNLDEFPEDFHIISSNEDYIEEVTV